MKTQNINDISKSQINKAAIILCDNKSHTTQEIYNSLEIASQWKAIHSYPLQIFKKRLQSVSKKIDKNAISSQRLKRVSSIIKKLNRSYFEKEPTMKLTQMQDVAGCRVILSNIAQVRTVFDKYYQNGYLKHKKVNVRDYIASPKLDGYRSIHLVYKYNSDKGKKEYNDLLVEIQIRTKLQHSWATAVETVDFFTKQALKSNQGEEEWKTFFKLTSSAFARLENTPIVSQTPQNEKELYLQIKEKEKELQVRQKMKHWMTSIKYFDDFKKKKEVHFYLLELDSVLERLNISTFTKKQEKQANDAYFNAEKKIFNRSEYDVVLVSSDNLSTLKKAYPNYFLDTKEFLINLERILNKY